MKKEFKIIEILDGIDNLWKIEKRKWKISEKKDYAHKNNALILNKQAESNKSEILVLDQMID